MSADKFSSQRVPLKRPRPVISCLECRRKKLKCDRLLPCQQCLKNGRSDACLYAPGAEPELRESAEKVLETTKRPKQDVTSGLTMNVTNSADVQQLLQRLQSLENALAGQQSQEKSCQETRRITQNSDDLLEDERTPWGVTILDKQPPFISQFANARAIMSSLPLMPDDSDFNDLALCFRAIQRSVKSKETTLRRASYGVLQDCLTHMRRLIPEPETCKKLVTLYFENFEHCARILHRQSFLTTLERYLTAGLPYDELKFFVPMLLGVLSIAASLNTLEECDQPRLHGDVDGTGAVQLLENWLDIVSTSSDDQLSVLQIRLLSMHTQRSRRKTDRELWISSGALVRQAMTVGLNDNVSPDQNVLNAEIRRRVWLTILEQDLALSIRCRMPANCPFLEANGPGNYNDEQLLNEQKLPTPSNGADSWTDGMCQYLLAQSFNARLAAYNFQFERRQNLTLGTVLEHARALEHVLRNLPAPFKLDQYNSPGHLMAQMEMDITLRRPLIALYSPFAVAMPDDDEFSEARIAWVQSNLVVLCFQDLFDPQYDMLDVPRPIGYWDFYYTAYKNEVLFGLYAQLLELQRMRQRHHNGTPQPDLQLQPHAGRSPSRALGWSIDGMSTSIEETLDPLVRRVGHSGPDLGDVVRWTLVFVSLKADSLPDISRLVKTGLKTLATTIRRDLEKEGYQIQTDVEASLCPERPLSRLVERTNFHWFIDLLHNR